MNKPTIKDANYFVGILKPNLPEPLPDAVLICVAKIALAKSDANGNIRQENADIKAAVLQCYEAGNRAGRP